MATPSDLARAPDTLIRRVAACVNRLEDRGETLATIQRRQPMPATNARRRAHHQ